jgi:hypothetical protein
MALKIQLRRDIAANWTANNPLLLNGEVGIETDTLKFKVGNGTQRWNALSSYALKPGEPNGVATLDNTGKIPLSQLPDQVSLDAEALQAIQNALSTISTTSIPEGTNLYFTSARSRTAVEGLYDPIGSAAQSLTSANAHTGVKFQDAVTAAAADATVKTNSAVTLSGQNADQKINTAILSLSTSVIPEGINLYFTNQRVSDIVTPLINNTRTYIDESLANFEAPSAISSTTQLPEGTNLYFTNARAVTATNAARTASLNAALSAVDDLRTELRTDIDNKIPYSDRNVPGGVVGLDSNSKIQDSIIPSTIARTSDITSAIADIVNLAPDSLNTLGELATAFEADQTGLSALVTTVGTKLDSSIAATTYAPISSPTFTGTPVIPGYATSINLTAGIAEAKDYTDLAIEGINNSLGGYQPEAEKNQASGYAGLDSNSKILESVIPTSITTAIAEATTKANANINGTYTNGSSSSNINKITYGTDLTPPSSGNSAGDIYIQY